MLQLANASGISVAKSEDALILTDASHTLTISDASSIATIELLGSDGKKTVYNMTNALSSISSEAISFDTGLAGYATTADMSETDQSHLAIVTGTDKSYLE